MVTLGYASEVRKAKGLSPKVPQEELENRIQRCKKLMRKEGFDALLVYGSPYEPSWIRYLANVIHPFILSQSYLLLPLEGNPVLLTDHKFFLSTLKKMTWVKDVRIYPYVEFPTQFDENIKLFKNLFKELGLESVKIGVCMLDMPATHFKALEQALPRATFKDATGLLSELIETKSPYDCRMIRKAAKIADKTMETALDGCEEGKTEYEFGLAAEATAIAHGAEFGMGSTVRTNLCIGSGSEVLANLRPYKYTAKKLKRGEMFFIDLVVCYNGYYIDFCRTVCVGKPTPKQKEIFEIVTYMHQELFKKLKPGVTGGELWDLAYNLARDEGYENRMNIWMGHGTGISVAEPPFMVKDNPCPLKKRTFVNIEPGIFLPETVGSAAIEDATFVDGKRAKFVTKCGRELNIV